MGAVLANLVPLAIVISVTPVGLLEMILVLFSRRWRVNSIVFLGLVIAGALIVPLVVAFGYSAATGDSVDAATSTTSRVVLGVLAALFLLMALRSFRNRGNHSMPKALEAIENMGPGPVALLAPGVTVVNPKNLAVLIAAGQTIGAAGFAAGQTIVAALAFAAMASATFIAAVALRLFGGPRADALMARIKAWLVHWNQTISCVLFGVLGIFLGAKALGLIG